MEPNLVVIGLNHRAAPVAERERFWLSQERRASALDELVRSEGVQEVAILTTCNRTEFILWTEDGSIAANSVQRFLSSKMDLRISEWKDFYRLLDEAAIVHLFRLASGLDSMVVGEWRIASQVREAWRQGQELGTTGHFLDALFRKALNVSDQVRTDTAIDQFVISPPHAAVDLAAHILGTLKGRNVVILGAGEMSSLSAQCIADQGVAKIQILSRTLEHAQEVAARVGGEALSFDQRAEAVAQADVVISATSCSEFVLTCAELEKPVARRHGAPLCVIDIAAPRDIDPGLRKIPGVYVYDIDALNEVVRASSEAQDRVIQAAENFVTQEARRFLRTLAAERFVPTIMAMRSRLDEICGQELQEFRHEAGPFRDEEEQVLRHLTERITRRIANLLAREMKHESTPEEIKHEAVTAALQELLDRQGRITAARRPYEGTTVQQ